jgi:hypothetical protein
VNCIIATMMRVLLFALLSVSALAGVWDAGAPWECHHYVGNQQETNWCATAGVQGDFEYLFVEGGVTGPCSPCWCCKRHAVEKSIANTTATRKVWVVSDSADELFGRTVPEYIVKDNKSFVSKRDHGIVRWMDSVHYVKLQVPAEQKGSEIFLRRYQNVPSSIRVARWNLAHGVLALSFIPLTTLAVLGVRRMRLRSSERWDSVSQMAVLEEEDGSGSDSGCATDSS